MFMGLGDIVIPGVLVVAAFVWLPAARRPPGLRREPRGRARDPRGVARRLLRAHAPGQPRQRPGGPAVPQRGRDGGLPDRLPTLFPQLRLRFRAQLLGGTDASRRSRTSGSTTGRASTRSFGAWRPPAGSPPRRSRGASTCSPEILSDEEMTTFLSFPADIVATGTRGVLAELVREGYVDALITTCGTLDHDLARGVPALLPRRVDARRRRAVPKGALPARQPRDPPRELRPDHRGQDAVAPAQAVGLGGPAALDPRARLADRRVARPRPGPGLDHPGRLRAEGAGVRPGHHRRGGRLATLAVLAEPQGARHRPVRRRAADLATWSSRRNARARS